MTSRPRLGFLGVGWIGRDRMRAIAASGAADVAAVADAAPGVAAEVAAEVGAAAVGPDELLSFPALDGVVIATPNALHAQQVIAALERGLAVFCQKPLGRCAAEVVEVTAAARHAGRLLGVDLSYRHLHATQQIRDVLASGGIGDVYAADLVFHNAYGPDKPWFLDRALSGGGCLIDLATHLVDLVLWLLPERTPEVVVCRRYAQGQVLAPGSLGVEDYATAVLDLSSGGSVTLACSWFLHAGQDAVISATFHGVEGSVVLRNVAGSFYDFEAALHRGTTRHVLSTPPDQWGGRAAVEWARAVAAGAPPQPDEMDRLVAGAELIDALYQR